MESKGKHVHEYRKGRGTVNVCSCGRFRHNEKAGEPIVEQRAKHTPGPWRGKYSHGYVDIPIEDEKGRFVARASAGGVFSNGEGYANARLIAAAPEMLEALREIHKLWCCPEPKRLQDWAARCDVMADYARAAIAKAEGRD